MLDFNYPRGYYKFHKTKIINFQMNRWHSLGYIRKEDCIDAASRIKTLYDFKSEMIRQGEKALAEGRVLNATFYYRAAEFFVSPNDPDKEKIYRKFFELFYNVTFKNEPVEKFIVPYYNTYLPVLRLKPKGNIKGTIVIHGGFDSFKEELISWAYYFFKQNYETIIFEGPGQGEALNTYNLPLSYKWEKSTKAVLDYFNLENVTLIGMSMGGWLCIRAAAFESRIKRVIASSVVFDYLQIPPAFLAKFVNVLLRYPRIMNYISNIQAKIMPQEEWGLNNLMHITKKDNPTEAAKELLKLNENNLHSERVIQDILILTGSEDHFIPIKMHYKQIAALKNAKSVTGRIFTKEDDAQNHCQIGNIGLALDVMISWLENYKL